MPKGDFSISGWSTRSDISLEVDKISGKGGPEYPCLSFPLQLLLRPLENKEKIKSYSLLWLKNSLYIENLKIGESISEPLIEYSWPQVASRQISIEIPLDLYRIEKIEERRKNDISFRLSGSALIVVHPDITRADPNEKQEYRKDITEFKKGSFDITFKIPHSHWVTNILPYLGYGKVKLIEIPIPEKIIPSIFQEALTELQQSQRYFREGDYDKVVAHCRNVIQLIPESLPLHLSDPQQQTFSKKVEIFLKEHLSIILSNSKRTSLAKIIKAIWNLSSIPHHPSPPGYFNRADAEIMFHITAALISYIGKLLKQIEKTN